MNRGSRWITRVIALSLLVASQASCGTNYVQIADRMYTVGAERKMRVDVPKRGFTGAPPSPEMFAALSGPVGTDDFDHYDMKVKVLNKRALRDDRLQVVLQICNETPGKNATNYVYLVVTSRGAYHVRRRTDDKELFHDGEEWIGGVPSAFESAIPPQLRSPDVQGYGKIDKSYVVSSIAKGAKTTVHVSRGVQTDKTVEPGDAMLVWYSKANPAPKPKASYKTEFSEKQIWPPNSWIWTEMTRTDPAGNVVLRCRALD